jgi:hypothetical protein
VTTDIEALIERLRADKPLIHAEDLADAASALAAQQRVIERMKANLTAQSIECELLVEWMMEAWHHAGCATRAYGEVGESYPSGKPCSCGRDDLLRPYQ